MNLKKYMLIDWSSSADILEAGQPHRRGERVLMFNLSTDQVIVIDVFDRLSYPVLRSTAEITTALNDKSAHILHEDPFSNLLIPEEKINKKHKQYRDTAW